jgi:enterochelin esterase family protein
MSFALLSLLIAPAPAADDLPMSQGPYTFGPDSMVHAGVPQGTWDKSIWDKSTIYPMTTREVWVYVPAQYDPKQPTCLQVIQDGPRQYAVREDTPADRRVRHTAEYRTPTVLDNLINRHELPVIITVFVNPGSFTASATGSPDFANRSLEYDTVSDVYSQFLFKEILPPVEAKYNIRKDPAGRAIGGISSGAICAFTVAWNHPDQFGKVFSDVGSFTNIRGGQVYPKLVADAAKKPLKVAMEDGTNDQRRPETPDRDWYLQNKLMHENLLAKGYEVRYVLGDGMHDSKHGGSIFPDTLRWLWSDQVASATTQPTTAPMK